MSIEYITPPELIDESVALSPSADECLWKTIIWAAGGADGGYMDDIDEISPDDGVNFP